VQRGVAPEQILLYLFESKHIYVYVHSHIQTYLPPSPRGFSDRIKLCSAMLLHNVSVYIIICIYIHIYTFIWLYRRGDFLTESNSTARCCFTTCPSTYAYRYIYAHSYINIYLPSSPRVFSDRIKLCSTALLHNISFYMCLHAYIYAYMYIHIQTKYLPSSPRGFSDRIKLCSAMLLHNVSDHAIPPYSVMTLFRMLHSVRERLP